MREYIHEGMSQHDAESDNLAQQDIQTGDWRNLYNSEL